MDLGRAASTALLGILSERVEEDRMEYTAEELASVCDIGFEDAEELAVALAENDHALWLRGQLARCVLDVSRMHPTDLKLAIVSGSWHTIELWTHGDLATITRFLDVITAVPGGSMPTNR